MKLNLDCIRHILLHMENCAYGETIYPNQLYPALPNYTSDEIDYSILKLHEAGFIQATIEKYIDGTIDIKIHDITYNGHQFLANIHENKIWSATKTVMGKIGATSIQAATEIATGVVTELIKATLFPLP